MSITVNRSTDTFDLSQFVVNSGGRRVIRRVLIANNGNAAVKAIRSIRSWSYDTFSDPRTIQFIAMASPEDLASNAEYLKLADEFVKVPGGPNNNNYANVSLIVHTAQQSKADAVWAGWGHASENPILPETLLQCSPPIQWIGPGPAAMRALGDKIASTIIAQSSKVPCVAWSGSGVVVDWANEGLDTSVYRKACVHNAVEAVDKAKLIGYPLMIKASEGGGGKGIRMVKESSELKDAFRQVELEVPGSPIFLMRLASDCRHLEVQLLADEHGNAIALAGRDCSIQRRHQKIIEEGPVLAACPSTWKQMERAAVRLAKAVGYVGAGTVEFLYNRHGEFFFLELNPRLQVEHPVTELICNVNLPALQLMVAMGIPLDRIPSIRRFFGASECGTDPIDFEGTTYLVDKHVIACRITAENPAKNFQPSSGTVSVLDFKSSPNVWGYFSISSGASIHEYADSQFGHLFASGSTRDEARRHMVGALIQLEIRGEIRTTVEFLKAVLEDEQFIRNEVSTTWLESAMKRGLSCSKIPRDLAVLLGSVFKGHSVLTGRQNALYNAIEAGRILPEHFKHLHTTAIDLILDDLKFSSQVVQIASTQFIIKLNGSQYSATVDALSSGVSIEIEGKRYTCHGKDGISGFRLEANGQSVEFVDENDPSELRAQMAGKIVSYLVKDGDFVQMGQSFGEMEVMKMCIPMVSSVQGRIKIINDAGSIVQAGQLIARLELEDGLCFTKAKPFEGIIEIPMQPSIATENILVLMRNASSVLRNAIHGFPIDISMFRNSLSAFIESILEPVLPIALLEEQLSILSGRMDEDVHKDLFSKCKSWRANGTKFTTNKCGPYPIAIQNILDDFSSGCETFLSHQLDDLLFPFIETMQQFSHLSADDLSFSGLRQLLPDRSNDVYVKLVMYHRRNSIAQLLCDLLTSHSQYLSPKTICDLTALDTLPQLKCTIKSLSFRSVTSSADLRSIKLSDLDANLMASSDGLKVFHIKNTGMKCGRLMGRVHVQVDQKENGESSIEKGIKSVLDVFESIQIPLIGSNHIYIETDTSFDASQTLTAMIQSFWNLHRKRLNLNNIKEIEISCKINAKPHSIFFTNPSQYAVLSNVFEEVDGVLQCIDAQSTQVKQYWNHQPVLKSYPFLYPLDEKRLLAERNETTYIYDFPSLFETVLGPSNVKFEELELFDDKIVTVDRPIGRNTIGMVAWKVSLDTRSFIVIGNDITFKAGSFGTKEDDFFFKVSQYSRHNRFPRIYLAANSGARLGLAREVIDRFHIAFSPSGSVQYLYLTERELEQIPAESIQIEPITVNGEIRFKITSVIGAEDGLGVENLRGSGMIAGETSRAYDEVFTLSYVTSRTVGIGAYLVRLGQRIIQKEGQPILLTGYRALNKLLGKDVYESNRQLGGTKVMGPNGISHKIVQNDLQGVQAILKWLQYIPWGTLNLPHPITSQSLSAPDTSTLLSFLNTFFDPDSLMQVMENWAPTILTGRARLGDIPCGFISVDTQSHTVTVPADPANPNSSEQKLQIPGQVWLPDSSYKTAQSIEDLNREQLPLFIFANWRGFSGGLNDMFNEVLKFGSCIVDALRKYRQPVFVYIVPKGELRGGAWVVLDPTINPDYMEMYADESSRAGILEPAGIVDVKFKKAQIESICRRLDGVLVDLTKKLELTGDCSEKVKIQHQIQLRMEKVYAQYHQAALRFADLHDTPHRMLAKGVISDIVETSMSRSFFYWRLRRKMMVLELFKEKRLEDEGFALFSKDVEREVEINGGNVLDDKIFCTDLVEHADAINVMLERKIASAHVRQSLDSLSDSSEALLAHITLLSEHLSEQDRKALLKTLSS